MWLEGLLVALSVNNIAWLLVGTLWGLAIGILPVLGATFAVVLMLPLTYSLQPATALISLCAAHSATNYGDSLTSILINVPGSPATVATCWDGYPMARGGQAGRALGIATLASFLGGVIAWLSFVLLAKPVSELAMVIGPPEYFALGVMALTLVAVAAKGETLKGLVMACAGLMLSTVGEDPIGGITFRFSFGIPWLEAGLPIVVSTLGIFGVSQIIRMLEEKSILSSGDVKIKDSILSGFWDVIRRPVTFVRSAIIGWYIGILPALGTSVAGIASYLVEKRFSKERESFGTGAPAGLVAAEAGKGACVLGDLIPTFTLGIPGSVTGAVLLAALIIHGIDPGPRFFLSGVLPYVVLSGLLLGQFAYVLIGPICCKLFARIAFLPNSILAPSVAVLAFLGAYAERNYITDIPLMIGFGILAYFVEKIGFNVVCLVLGLILGPLIEANLGRSLEIAFGSPSIFLERPIVIVLFAITLFFLLVPYLWSFFISYWKKLPRLDSLSEEKAAATERTVRLSEWITLLSVGLVMGWGIILSKNYPDQARLFPNVIAVSGLVIIVFRLTILSWITIRNRGLRVGPSGVTKPKGRPVVSWPVSLLLLLGCAALIYIVGFVVSTVLFVATTAFIAGYRKPVPLVALALGAGIFCWAFAKGFDILLPKGFFF